MSPQLGPDPECTLSPVTTLEQDAKYRARDLTNEIKLGLEDVWLLIKEAYESRAWAALGYSSWDEYCTVEFGSSRLRLPKEDRRDVVTSLREAGLSTRAIAAATGDSQMTVQRIIATESNDSVAAAAPANVIGINGKTYRQSAPKVQAVSEEGTPEWRGKPITPDLKDQIFGRGITANDQAAHQIDLVVRAAEFLVDGGFSPVELKAAARPGDVDRWVEALRASVAQVNRFLRQLEH